MQLGTPTVENSIKVVIKTKYRVAIWFSNLSPGNISEKTIIQKGACTPMFIAELFTIAKTLKQPKCPSTEE